MEVLAFTVINKEIGSDIKQVVGDNDYQASFLLDEEWDDKEVICRVVWNNTTSLDIKLEDLSCVIPAYIMKRGEVSIGVYVDGDEQLTTSPWKIGVVKSIREKEFETAVPHKAVWDGINEKVKDVVTHSEFDEQVDAKMTAYLGEKVIGGTTKVINVMDNNIANCVIDGVTDDFAALNEIKKYVNSTTEPITLLFPYTNNAMILSDMIHFTRSNITLEVYCDITFTKAQFEKDNHMNVFKFGRISDRTPISNINFIGHNITINANGAALGIAQKDHAQVAEGNGIRFQRINGGLIKGVHVTNALCDGILVYNSKNVIVEDCEVSGTVMDNGLTVMGLPLFTTDWVFDKYADRCRNNVIVRNCVAHNNEDLGFSASVCYGVTFENCFSYENGNADGLNAGGGFSAEGLNMSAYFEVSDMTYDMDISFRNCRALNNNNYAFYTDVNGMTVDGCIIDKTVANDTTTSSGRNIRGGNAIFSNAKGRLDVLNTYISNADMYAVCTNPNSNINLRLERLNVTDCEKGVYVPCVAFLHVKDLICKNTNTPINLNDGTKKKYVELKNISLYDCTGVYIGGAEYMDADNVYLRTADGVTVAMTLGNVDTGVLQNAKVYKGDNTKWLTGIYINDTTGTDFSVSTSMLTDANTTITDKRVTE